MNNDEIQPMTRILFNPKSRTIIQTKNCILYNLQLISSTAVF